MALKALLLRKKLDDKKKALELLRQQDADFELREADLTKSIAEVTEETPDEAREAVDEAVAAFDADKTAHEDEKHTLEDEIAGLERDLAAEEAAQNTDAPIEEPRNERKEVMHMNIPESRAKMFGATLQERTAFFEREEVKSWLSEIRSCIKEKRALTNVGLTIPEVFLGILRENLIDYSKLYRHVNVRPINGEGREVIMGTIPEAVWTDCCANLNELDLAFADVEVNCWRVGGYFEVCNANLEDSDIDLAAEIIAALGQAIGKALDKAILFGTGSRMPQGVVTRLAQTSQPADYPATGRPWVDLHTSNVKTISSATTGIDFFKALAIDSGAAKGKYSRGEKVWCMNETTYNEILVESMNINANGAIVAGVNGTMPVIGGIIEVMDIVPDDTIIGGYFDLYLLGERAGQKFASSEHYKFLADKTVFKGTARYDGKPVIGEAFVAIGINGASVATTAGFAPDNANSVQSIRLNTSTASIVGTGSVQLIAITEPGSGTVTWASATTSKATVDQNGVVTGVTAGSSVITATCDGKTASCTVTVT